MCTQKLLKKNSVFSALLILMLVFGFVSAVTFGVNAATIGPKVTYVTGEGPAETAVTGMPEENPTTLPVGTSSVTLAAAPSAEGFIFAGWKDANGEIHDGGSTMEIAATDSELTFTAVWAVKVTYDKNLDNAETVTAPADGQATYKTDFKIEEKMESTTEYEFLGWATEANKDNAEPEFKVGDVIKGDTVTAPITLYAIWKEKFLTVTYHANTGNDTTDATVTVPQDSTKYIGSNLKATIMGAGNLASDNPNAATMKDAVPTRSGYTFAGWTTDSKSTEVKYKPGDVIDPMTENLDLYAVWTTTVTSSSTVGTSASNTTNTPQTGAEDNLILYIVMAVLSLMGIGYLCYDQKKAKASK